MKISRSIRAFLEESKTTDSYWVEQAKLDFAMSLEKQRRIKEMTRSAIAEKISTSAAYITKVLRGDSNVTIETMVKLARATGGELNIQIVNAAIAPRQWDIASIAQKKAAPQTTSQSATVISLSDFAANTGKNNHAFKAAA